VKGEKWYKTIGAFARMYIDHQQLRIGCGHRILKTIEAFDPELVVLDEGPPKEYVPIEKALNTYQQSQNIPNDVKEALKIMEKYYYMMLEKEKQMLKDGVSLIGKGHELVSWCDRTKGLGDVALLTFLGYINPFKCLVKKATERGWRTVISSNKAFAYCGLVPGAKLESGKKGKYNPIVKGRLINVIATNVVRARDPYYVPIYRAKKEYLLNVRGFSKYIENPATCPKYEECMKKLLNKSKRLQKPMKRPACRGHVDGLARFFLAKILVANATELMGREEGYGYATHTPYIPPKPEDPLEVKQTLNYIVPAILKGEKGEKPTTPLRNP